MMKDVINKILMHIISEGYIEKEDWDVYYFGLECMFLKMIHYISYMIIGCLLDSVREIIISAFILIPLRRKSGGYHAKTKMGCYIFSCCMVVMLCMMNKCRMLFWNDFLGMIVADFVIYIMAPIENENRALSELEKNLFRKQSLLLLLITNICYIILMFFISKEIARYLRNGVVLASLLCLMGKFDNWLKT